MSQKRWLFFPLFICLALLAHAQEQEDVVYLKNGSEIRGALVSSDDSSVVKIEIIGGSIFVFDRDEILAITREESKVQPQISEKKVNPIKDEGFYTTAELGLGFGQQNGWPVLGIGMDFNVGYQFKPIFRAGLGLGVYYYSYQHTYSPISLHLSGDFLKKKVTPYYYLNLGWSRNLTIDNENETFRGGRYINVGGGFKINTSYGAYFMFFAGFKSQAGSVVNSWDWDADYTNYYNFNRLNTGLALGF